MFKVKESGYLWFFYRKCYTLQGLPLKTPTNFFIYIWKVWLGVKLWFRREVGLLKLWVLTIVLLGLLVGFTLLLPSTPPQPKIVELLVMTSFNIVGILWMSSFIVAFVTTFYRSGDKLVEKFRSFRR